MAATAGPGEVDRLDKGGVALLELPARAGVDLAIGFDIEGIGAGARQEFVTPVIGDTGLNAVLVIEENRVGAVRQAGERELGDARRLAVVVGRVAADDGVVEDGAEAGFPEIMLDREFEAIEMRRLVGVDRRRHLEIDGIILGQTQDPAGIIARHRVEALDFHRRGVVGEDIVADRRRAGAGAQRSDRRLIAWTVCRVGEAEGVGVDTFGNIYGGKMADRMGPIRALTLIFSGLAAILLVLTLSATHPVAAVLTVLVWGAFAFGNVPGLQVYVVQQAERFVPEAVDVASGLNIAAFNIGIALGSVVGGHIVADMALTDTAWIGAGIVILALGLTRLSGALDRRGRTSAASI